MEAIVEENGNRTATIAGLGGMGPGKVEGNGEGGVV